MARGYMTGVGGGSGSDECTGARAQLLEGYTGILKDTDDEPMSGTMTNHGAINQSLGINGTYTIPAGYHNGSGKVTQSIPIQGALTLNPGTTQKTGYVSGKYMTGNITVPAVSIPAEWIKKGQRVTFPDGSFVDGVFEGYVGDPTDLYYMGVNNAQCYAIAQTPLATLVFESNMIRVTGGGNNDCRLGTKVSYNFTPYTQFIVEYEYLNPQTTRGMQISLMKPDSTIIGSVDIPPNSGLVGQILNASINISSQNITTNPTIQFTLLSSGLVTYKVNLMNVRRMRLA